MISKNKFELGQEVFVSFVRGKASRFTVQGVEYYLGEIRYLLHEANDETYAFECMLSSSKEEALKFRYLIDKEVLEGQIKQLSEELKGIEAELA